jgi:hypothetical protein
MAQGNGCMGQSRAGGWNIIREALRRGQLTSCIRFVEEVSEKIGRRVKLRGSK